jgi:hypothetical protein
MSLDDPTQGAGAANYEDVVSSTDFDWKQVAGVRHCHLTTNNITCNVYIV